MNEAALRAHSIDEAAEEFARDLVDGLQRKQKKIACKYFYDARGSELFDRICRLPEYYQTRTEMALLRDHAGEIARLMGRNVELVEFGAGSLAKVRILLDALETPQSYVPIDISGEYLLDVAVGLEEDYPDMTLRPVIADFTQAIDLPKKEAAVSRRVGFFPGSTIGNFTRDAAVSFLKNAARTLGGGGLLIGTDLVKDPSLLHAAYNDSSGVTAAFNKNLLLRANRELGANFDLNNFAHSASYNALQMRIEMYLVSLVRQTVRVAGETLRFGQGEAIHTEDSHKYTIESFTELAVEAGFAPRKSWTDANRLFAIHWLETR
ncbi:MAG TPA: L-histidine N(alpha)-methyltransferase [Rhizomicrobium sp.]|nr:L-histidine N(alpha)-methyltransferase [Rhizomicrobium sp.]